MTPFFLYAVKRQPKLKSKYQDHVEKVIEYAKTVESWDDLVDPRTLTFYCLGPDLSPYELCIIELKEKRISVRFVSIDPFMLTWININKCSPLAELTTKFRHVCPDEEQEGRALVCHWG